jgi:hypothetical protein
MYHRVAESFKWAYAQRSKLGDPFDTDITDFVNQVKIQNIFLVFVETKKKLIVKVIK